MLILMTRSKKGARASHHHMPPNNEMVAVAKFFSGSVKVTEAVSTIPSRSSLPTQMKTTQTKKCLAMAIEVPK